MLNPNGESNSQVVLENNDLRINKVITIYEQVFMACQPMVRFI